MDYSLNKRKMSVGPLKGKEVFVASPVCQKQRVSFEKLCERMAEDSTVGDADVAAVFYKFRKVLSQLCSMPVRWAHFAPRSPRNLWRKRKTSSRWIASRRHRFSSRLRRNSAS